MTVAETTFGQELYDSVAPLAYADGDNNDALLTVCDGMGTMAAQLELLTREDDDGNAPWSIIMDAARAPGYMLPYIAQFVGQTIPVGTSDDDARALIRSPSNQERGTLTKLVHDVKITLTGSKTVLVIERETSEYDFGVYVQASECPDPDVTEAAILATKPAGLLLNFVVADGTVINALIGTINAQTGTIDSL